MTGSQQPPSFPDVEQLRRALLEFLGDDHTDWNKLARELRSLARSRSELEKQDARRAWLALADFLAQGKRNAGTPPEVARLLATDAAARAAEEAFNAAMSQRQAWIDFARHLESESDQA